MPETPLTAQTRVRRIEDVLDTELGDETVMMDIERGSYFSLNPTGSRIWDLLAEPRSIDELCDRLLQQFDVSRDKCERQVVDFVSGLLERGLVQVVADEPPQ